MVYKRSEHVNRQHIVPSEYTGLPIWGKQVCCLSVVPSVSVESTLECQMRVNDMFCAVSLSGTMWSAAPELLEKTAADGNASP